MRAVVLTGIAVLLALGVGLAARGDDRSACGELADQERALSPDGTKSALVRCTSEGSAWVYVAEDGDERQVVPTDYGCCYRPSESVIFRDPAWSRDGRHLAVVIDDVGGTDVWVIALAQLSARRVTAGPARERDPEWSADGRRITFRTETGGVASVPVRTGEAVRPEVGTQAVP